jgi:4-amino-4-deoxy-L-arabinose transferase-like glycosyltransferase
MSQPTIFSPALVSLPVIGYLLLFWIARRRGSCWRSALMRAAVVWGMAAVLITEILSRPYWLTRRGLAITWAAVDLVLGIVVWRWPKRAEKALTEANSLGENPDEGKLRKLDLALLAGVGLILLLTLITALVAPPNHGDVMSYHLPRIVFWLQNHSVRFFPTNDGRQLDQPPGTEYAVMQFHALFGGDRFDGMIQWFGYALSAVIATLIGRAMGAGRRAQILIAVFCVTMPFSIVQATNGKNDCVAACLLAAMAYYLLTFRDDPSRARMLGVGAALGLGLMAKGTTYFFAPPLLLALALTWPKKTWIKALKYAPLGIALLISLNLPHWKRNYWLSGSPVGPDNEWGARYANDIITPAAVFSGLLKNAAAHMRTPSEKLNHSLERGVANVVSAVGADVNDPRTNWGGTYSTFRIPYNPVSETYASNTWHFLLLLVTLATMIFSSARRLIRSGARNGDGTGFGNGAGSWELWAFTLGLIGAFIFFCAILRWQSGIARFHIPLFVLWSIPVTLALTRVRANFAIAPIAGLLLLLALPWAVNTARRSMLPGNEFCIFTRSRMELYFAVRPQLLAPYRSAAEAVNQSGCADVGISSDLDLLNYPILVLLKAENGDRPVKPVQVIHPSKAFIQNQPEFRPCAVISLSPQETFVKAYEGRSDKTLRFENVTVFFSKSGFSP